MFVSVCAGCIRDEHTRTGNRYAKTRGGAAGLAAKLGVDVNMKMMSMHRRVASCGVCMGLHLLRVRMRDYGHAVRYRREIIEAPRRCVGTVAAAVGSGPAPEAHDPGDTEEMHRTASELQLRERKEYMKLVQQIKYHDAKYYADVPEPEISDEAYDALMKKLVQIERVHPDWVTSDSPSQAPGFAPNPSAVADGFPPVRHQVPMLSLSNTYNPDDVADFVKRVNRELAARGLVPEPVADSETNAERNRARYCVELKADGIAITLQYEKGVLKRAITRGNGRIGDDVTRNAVFIQGVPRELRRPSRTSTNTSTRKQYESLPDRVEVRGEVYMSKSNFRTLNEQRAEQGLDPFSNARNAAGGALKLLDPELVVQRRLSFVAYEMVLVGEIDPAAAHLPTTQYDTIYLLDSLGFPIVPFVAQCSDEPDEIISIAKELERMRDSLELEADGVVVKLNDNELRRALGITARAPRGAVAFKFTAEQAITRMLGVRVQVSRAGVLTPVAELEPVKVGGVTVSRATLHNYAEIKALGLRIGDTVQLMRSGDVIPKITGVVRAGSFREQTISTGAREIVPPQECPVCQSKIEPDTEDVFVRCSNRNCEARSLSRLMYFGSKSGMDIDSLGTATISKLVDAGLVQRAVDFYRLSVEQLEALPGFKSKSARRLYDGIQASKQSRPLARIITALGIPGVGATTAESLARAANYDLERVVNADEQMLTRIDGVALKSAGSILAFLRDPEERQHILDLTNAGLKPLEAANVSVLAASETSGEGRALAIAETLLGKIFVFTGSLGSDLTRVRAIELVQRRGGIVRNAVTSKTDFVVSGDKSGTKLDRAHKLGVTVLDVDTFTKLVA
ncbi:DNA ligase [Porphyridium purpureum]|uniref:DNA ligase (NAD(+)) n=1 Tax=Porphyridium purpureum TaxID=35688 RepID=A0A5J4YYC6_PORPP|nr:DNA ligase [Porphyridium purpureum]|eukprot:POR7343..scf209_3